MLGKDAGKCSLKHVVASTDRSFLGFSTDAEENMNAAIEVIWRHSSHELSIVLSTDGQWNANHHAAHDETNFDVSFESWSEIIFQVSVAVSDGETLSFALDSLDADWELHLLKDQTKEEASNKLADFVKECCWLTGAVMIAWMNHIQAFSHEYKHVIIILHICDLQPGTP